jgi:geranylgeranyl reductase family protein
VNLIYDVAVVGGGPAGLALAKKLCAHNVSAVVLEEHDEVGMPVHCAGLISKTGCEEHAVDLGGSLMNKIRGAKIFSPGGKMLIIEKQDTVAYVVDREKFDLRMAQNAISVGAEIKTGTKFIDANKDSIFVKVGNRGGLMKAKFVVGADGAASRVRELMGLKQNEGHYIYTYQMKLQGAFDHEFVEMHFGDFSKNFFAWVIPESKTVARVGIGTGEGNAKKAFEEFVSKKQLQGDFFSESAGIIPIGRPLKELAKPKMAIVGDAAFQTKATTGGGILSGIEAANYLGDALIANKKGGKKISDYEKMVRGLNRELEMHYKIRSYLNSMDKFKMDFMFEKLKKAGIEEFLSKEGDMDKPSRFLGKAIARPKMWGLLPELLSWTRA